MAKLFTDEFCQLLDELESTDTLISRQVEDLYNLLINKGIITKEEIYGKTIEVMNKRQEIRQSLQAKFNEWSENK